jgi:peptidoglycan-associated lipoprotein
MTRTTSTALLSILLATAFAGCSSTPPSVTPSAATPAVVAAPAVAPVSAPAAMPPTVAMKQELAAHLDPASMISRERSLYFDFDSFAVKSEYRTMLSNHASYLGSAPSLTIRIEGNSDERGGTEYNLALGQKRAEAVRRSLKVLGVKEAQMEATSWGEERPQATGHNEAAWSQNRRVDLVYSK